MVKFNNRHEKTRRVLKFGYGAQVFGTAFWLALAVINLDKMPLILALGHVILANQFNIMIAMTYRDELDDLRHGHV